MHQNRAPSVYYPFSDLFRHRYILKCRKSWPLQQCLLSLSVLFSFEHLAPRPISRKMFQCFPCFHLQVSCGVLEVLPTRPKGPGTRMGRGWASGTFSLTAKGKCSGMSREIPPVMVITKSRYCSPWGINYTSANVLGLFLDPAFPFWSFSCSKGLLNLGIQGLIFLFSTGKSSFLIIS